jgi:hypothetical protein
MLLVIQAAAAQTIKSPAEFLGYEPGTQFTWHHKTVEYFRQVADLSPKVKFMEYGTTYEGRPLTVCFISSEENIKNLEELRMANLVNTSLAEGEKGKRQIPFVWLAYNVHGNESVGMETSMDVLYTLVTEGHKDAGEWLKNMVIVIDPCQNPDGRDRYTNQYRATQPVIVNPDRTDWSHQQGWPGARSNHYLFDLNRDWVWQTQGETQQRLALYNRYMPHVHADFHEMGPDSPFFFPPGADPWHEIITPWQREFHKLTGKENATLFDQKERLYFTRESFDLFCPSFGDTWPLFNGAMGFTYEQGGGGAAGLALETSSGDTLTLAKRMEGHYLASIATIQAAYNNREKLIEEFNKFFNSGLTSPVFEYGSVIIKGDNDRSALEAFLQQLDRNQIRYSAASPSDKTIKGFDYLLDTEGSVKIEKGDIVVSAYQPQSNMVKVLFEPDSKFTDSLSYDITGWALPYVYSLKAYAVKGKVATEEGRFELPVISNETADGRVYAFLAKGTGFNELRLMAALYSEKINVRYAMKPFTAGDIEYPRGSLIIARGDNSSAGDNFEKKVTELANKNRVVLERVSGGFSQKGIDLGSNYTRLNKKPEIALAGGEGTSAGSFGEIWYFLEQELQYPVTVIPASDLGSAGLDDYDVLILPSGSYTRAKDNILEYVRGGGRVVALERAVSLFAAEKGTKLFESVEKRKKEQESAEKKQKSDDTSLLKSFENSRRESIKSRAAYAIYAVKVDETHPMAYGLGNLWFIMKRTDIFPFIADGNNIGYILESEPVSGFAGSEFQEKVKNTLVAGSESIGRGEVIYLPDNPYFRGYWKSGRVILGNAILR